MSTAWLEILIFAGGGYLLLTLVLCYVVQHVPRRPVVDPPDWGTVTDTFIPAADGGRLEVWRIDPEGPSCGVVVFAHGWGRNRDRMINRARLFGGWGYTCVIHSARDHGNSSPRRFMNAVRFAEDIESVLAWVGQPVILYGHSAGAGGAIVAADRCPGQIRVLILEAGYADTRPALLSLYRWVHPMFGILLGPMILNWMNLFYRGRLDIYSPARVAPRIRMPVFLVHGEKDRRFPLSFALRLQRSFPEAAGLYVGKDAGHSDASRTPGYAAAVKAFVDAHRDRLSTEAAGSRTGG